MDLVFDAICDKVSADQKKDLRANISMIKNF